jgi:hypothetical protein
MAEGEKEGGNGQCLQMSDEWQGWWKGLKLVSSGPSMRQKSKPSGLRPHSLPIHTTTWEFSSNAWIWGTITRGKATRDWGSTSIEENGHQFKSVFSFFFFPDLSSNNWYRSLVSWSRSPQTAQRGSQVRSLGDTVYCYSSSSLPLLAQSLKGRCDAPFKIFKVNHAQEHGWEPCGSQHVVP